MTHRTILTERQRNALFALPTDEPSLLKHYTLADDDLEYIRERRRPENKLGFALQLCALRYPGRLLSPGEVIPEPVIMYLAAQLGLSAEALAEYAIREETRHEHLAKLREVYGYRSFSGVAATNLKTWLAEQAEKATTNENLVQRFIVKCRRTQIILPAVSTIERLCADTLVAAERRIENRLANRLDNDTRVNLDNLLTDMAEIGVTRFVWLRQFEVGNNSAAVNRLLDRLEFLRDLSLSPEILSVIPTHRITRLRRQGERYFADGLRDISDDRRLSILAVCCIEWKSSITDAIVETHDRIVGKTWRKAKRLCDTQIEDSKSAVRDTLRSFAHLGSVLLEAHNADRPIDAMISQSEWVNLEKIIAKANKLTDTMSADPLAHVVNGYHRFRRYAHRMLTNLEIEASPVSQSLLEAVRCLINQETSQPIRFLKRSSKWQAQLRSGDRRIWEVAVLFHLRDAFRSGDIWLQQSRRYADIKETLVPLQTVHSTARLSVPFDPHEWISDRKEKIEKGLKRLSKAAHAGALPNGSIKNGTLRIERLNANVPSNADELILDLYKRMPEIRITDLLIQVDAKTNFTEAFTHLRTGVPCKDKIGLLNVLLAEGINLGLRKMAEASNTHDYWQLSRLSRWHVESEAINNALAMVVEAQAQLPISQFWGIGMTASSDGQFFSTTRQGEAMNLINAKYGTTPGLKAYTHVSDQFAPFATQTIPATVNEAPYILDGLLMNETGKQLKEQYADTGGFTDHVFAVTSLLGYQFVPRIRDLSSKRLYAFNPATAPKAVKGLIGGKIRENPIIANWPDVLRSVATMTVGKIQPSQLLRKFASYPRQHDLAVALREIGRIERTLFIINWILDIDMQRRAQIGLNKGESHHALKNALRIGRQGEIRDRTSEGQHYRMAGLNLLAAIIIYWNSIHLGKAINQRKLSGLNCEPELLTHISPLGWAHILLTGEYRWPKIP